MTPKVSVIMSSYNHASYLQDAVQSILNQTFLDFELIAVDDGSTDGSRGILSQYAGDTRVRCFFEAHEGPAVTRNKCFQRARGQYIAILDSDDVWLSDKLEKQVAFLDSHPEIALLHGRVEMIDASGRLLPQETFVMKRAYEVAQKTGEDYNGLSQHLVILSSTVLMRKACLDRTGYLDPSLESMWDFDLYLRIALEGYRIGFLNGLPIARYRYRGQLGHTGPVYSQALLQILRKHLALLEDNGKVSDYRLAYRNFLIHMASCYYFLNQPAQCRALCMQAVRFDVSSLFRKTFFRNFLMSLVPVRIVCLIRRRKTLF